MARSRRATKRRRRFFAGATALAVGVVAILSVAGLGQRHTAQSRSLAAQAIAEISRDPWAALANAVKAAETAATPEATNALRLSLSAPREALILREASGSAIHSARFTDDGQYVITTAYDGTIRRWVVGTGDSEVTGTAPRGRWPPGRPSM